VDEIGVEGWEHVRELREGGGERLPLADLLPDPLQDVAEIRVPHLVAEDLQRPQQRNLGADEAGELPREGREHGRGHAPADDRGVALRRRAFGALAHADGNVPELRQVAQDPAAALSLQHALDDLGGALLGGIVEGRHGSLNPEG
jgi:hypothetical protein